MEATDKVFKTIACHCPVHITTNTCIYRCTERTDRQKSAARPKGPGMSLWPLITFKSTVNEGAQQKNSTGISLQEQTSDMENKTTDLAKLLQVDKHKSPQTGIQQPPDRISASSWRKFLTNPAHKRASLTLHCHCYLTCRQWLSQACQGTQCSIKWQTQVKNYFNKFKILQESNTSFLYL